MQSLTMHSQPREAAIFGMTLSPRLWAGLGLACALFTFPARAAAAPEHSSSAPQNAEAAVDGAAPAGDAHTKSERPGDAASPRTGEQPGAGAGSKVRNSPAAPRPASETPQRGIQQGAHGNADRVHSSPLNNQTRGRPARQSGRPLASNRAATNGLAPSRAGNNGLAPPRAGNGGGASAATPAASKRNALPVAKLATAPRNPAIGGPHTQSAGRLDGAVVGRANHSAAIDGTQFRPRF